MKANFRILVAFALAVLIAPAHAADLKISQLPAASSVGSTDIIPIVQSSTTKRATAVQMQAGVIPAVAYASLPSAASASGFSYRVTDVGSGHCLFYSDGTIWRPVGGRCVLAASSIASSALTGTTSETVFDTIAIPANIMGPNGTLEITTVFAASNDANLKNPRVRFSGASGTIFMEIVNTSWQAGRFICSITNRNATNSQVGAGINGTGAGVTSAVSIATAAVDTTAATSLVISGQLNNSGASLTRHAYRVELIVP